ncbi:MAG: class I SAM-dependent methyltransferase [Halobacteriaceae archaeon]
MSEDPEMTPEAYYDQHPDREANRLDGLPTGQLEFANTCRELDVVLPEDGYILDAGGGPGRYSVWLAEQGYGVEHCDLSIEQVGLARARVADHNLEDRVACRSADIRSLPYAADHFDGVCCLGGPLSHLLDPADRATALAELGRVGAPGAPVLVAVMGRLAALRDTIKHVLPDADPPYGLLEALAEDGRYTADRVDEYRDGDGWAETKFFRAAELERECEAAGLPVERRVGLEGIASNLAPELAELDDAAMGMVEDVVADQRTDPAVVDNAEHILAVCRVPRN